MAGSGGNTPNAPATASPIRVLVDTNVVLDVVLARQPWATQTRAIFTARDAGQLALYLPASVLTDIFYICRKQVGADRAKVAVGECLNRYVIVPVDRGILATALTLPNSDFEDNVQIVCAQIAAVQFIVTRNVVDFVGSPIPAVEPIDLASRLSLP